MAKKTLQPNIKSDSVKKLESQLEANRKAAIESGEIIDPKIIEEKQGPTPIKAGGIETYYDYLPGDYYDKFEDYINPNTLKGRALSLDQMKQLRFENQTFGQEAGNAVERVAKNVVPSIIGGFASMVDIPGYWNAEHAANNSIVNWAESWKQDVNENSAPIYTDPLGDTMDLGSSAWWFSRGSGLVESVASFLVQGAGIGKGVSILGKGIGAMVKGKTLFSALSKVPGFATGAEAAAGLGKGAQTLTTAVMLNQSEAVIEATQVYKDVYDSRLAKGFNPSEAKQAAADAASVTMNLNRINILLNLTSASAFLTPMKTTRELIKKGSTARTLGELSKEGSQEAMEELINHVASKAGTAKGEGKKYGWEEAMKDMGSMEGFEAAFLGALGGIAQTGGQKVNDALSFGSTSMTDDSGAKISKNTYDRRNYDKQQEVINEMKEKGVRVNETLMSLAEQDIYTTKLQKAMMENDEKAMDELRDQHFDATVVKAFESGTTQVLEDLFKAETQRNPEEVGEEYINNAKKAVKKLKELESIYNNFEEYANVNDIFYNRATSLRFDEYLKNNDTLRRESLGNFSNDASTIAKKYNFQHEKTVLFKKEGEVVRTESSMEDGPLTFSLSDIENNTQTSEHNKEVYNKFLKEIQELPSYESSKYYEKEGELLSDKKVELEKELKELTSDKVQEKATKEKDAKQRLSESITAIPKMKSVLEIKKLKSELNNEQFNKLADARIQELEKATIGKNNEVKAEAVKKEFIDRLNKATSENITEFYDEIKKLSIPDRHKEELKKAYAKKVDLLEQGIEETTTNLTDLGFESTTKEEVEHNSKIEEINAEGIDPRDPKTESKDVEAEVVELAESLVKEDKTSIVGEDSEGNLIYNFIRSTFGAIRAAYQSRAFNQTNSLGEVNREDIDNEIQHKHILDPNALQAGTKITLSVSSDYTGDVYVNSSTSKEKITWAEKKSQLQEEADKEGVPLRTYWKYIDEVPIIATDGNGLESFYVHDVNWIKKENLDLTEEELGQERALLRRIRKRIVADGSVSTEIDYKSNGRLFKTHDGKNIPLNEAMPDVKLSLAIRKDQEFKGNKNFRENKNTTQNQDKTTTGRLYAIVPTGQGVNSAIPLIRKEIDERAITSITKAVELYLGQDEKNETVKEVFNKTGLNITNIRDLDKYISMFINVTGTDKQAGLSPLLQVMPTTTSKLQSNHKLLAVTSNTIEFGKPGVNIGRTYKGEKERVAQISLNFSDNKAQLDQLKGFLQGFLANADMNTLFKDGNVAFIGEDNTISSMDYNSFVKETHETNILSINIGSEEKPKYVYTIQPTITFSTNFLGQEKSVKKETPSLKKTIVEKPKTPIKQSLNYKGVNPTVDLIVTKVVNGETQVLLIKRGDNVAAEAGKLAFPGGFHDTDAKKGSAWKPGKETVEEAAIRELKEETGLDLNKSSLPLLLLNIGTFNDQARDPRNSEDSWVSATVFRVTLPENFDVSTEVSGQDDAKNAQWVPVSELSTIDKSQFGFDHADILESEGLVYFKETVPNTKKTITRKYVTLETPITAFGPEEQALLNNPTPTIEEYEAVVQKLEKLVKIAKQPANKILFETALRDIKNSFEISDKQPATSNIEAKKAEIERRRQEKLAEASPYTVFEKGEKPKKQSAPRKSSVSTSENIIKTLTVGKITQELVKEGRIVDSEGNGIINLFTKGSSFFKLGLKLLPGLEGNFLSKQDELNLANLSKTALKNHFLDIINTLSPYLVNTNVHIYKDSYVKALMNKRIAFASGDDIYMGTTAGRSLQLLTHELIHTVTMRGIDVQSDLYDVELDTRITELYEIAVKKLKENVLEKDYGITNKDEFLAEAFANPIFMLKLAKLETTASNRRSNVFQDLISSIVAYFQKNFNINIESTVLQEVINAVGIHLEDNSNNYTQIKESSEYVDAKDAHVKRIKELNEEFNIKEKELPKKTKEINAEFDAELAALEQPTTSTNQIKSFVKETTPYVEAYLSGGNINGTSTLESKAFDARYPFGFKSTEPRKIVSSSGTTNYDYGRQHQSFEDGKVSYIQYEENNKKYLLVAYRKPSSKVTTDSQRNGFVSLKIDVTQGVSQETLNKITELQLDDNLDDKSLMESLTNAVFNINQTKLTALEETVSDTRTIEEEVEQIVINGQEITIPLQDLFDEIEEGQEQEVNPEDSQDISDDVYDELPSTLEKSALDKIQLENDSLLIKGVSPRTQESLISYLSAKVTQASIKAEKKNKKKSTVKTKDILEKEKDTLQQLSDIYKTKNQPNNAKRIDTILDQWNKVTRLTQEYLSLYTTGSIYGIEAGEDENDGNNERTHYADDWTFTVSSKSTASADLKKFFAYVPAVDVEGKAITNLLGLPDVIPFDKVYDTVHRILANKVSDYDTMKQHLELWVDTFPWLIEVIKNLDEASTKIKNEFVADMTKHYINMQYVQWSKDANGNYVIQTWNSNSSSIEQVLRTEWNNNLKGVDNQSNLVTVNNNKDYVFNQEEVNLLANKAKEWTTIPPLKTEEGIKELSDWLSSFGIVISDKTYTDLIKGRFKNKKLKTWEQLFTDSDGLVNVLAKRLKASSGLLIDDVDLLSDTVVKNLAAMDAKNVSNAFSNSYQAGTKTIYSYTNNNYIINRMRDLVMTDGEGNLTNLQLIEDLQKIAFTKNSLWLNDISNTESTGDLTKSIMRVNYVSLEALKKSFTPSKDNRKLNNLSDAEHEVAKLGMFFNSSKNDISETGETRRVVNFFYPTMADKSTMITIQALSKEFNSKDGEISDESLKVLYQTIVEPEILRIATGKGKNVKNYTPEYFYFIPSLNNEELLVTINDETKSVRQWILDGESGNPEVTKVIKEELKSVFSDLITKKLAIWEKLGIGKYDLKTKSTSLIDKSYLDSVAKGLGKDRVTFAAQDFVFNSLIANAEMLKLGAGDPAQYFKKSSKKNATIMDHLEETFINLGKRLAGEIAPGMELADSQNNSYIQVFLADQTVDSLNVSDEVQRKYFENIIDNFSSDKVYGKIEGSDAQEYTTWQEHLYVLRQSGKISDIQYDLFKSKIEKEQELTYDELGTVLQPLKPVYNGNIVDVNNNIDRKVYIKSSSFPLIPQLTKGLQIDAIRKSLETLEKEQGKTVRASFGTANKVGAVKATKVFDEKGNVIDNIIISTDGENANILTLPRSNFRIQQDVPYKQEKAEVNIGTQERKLLFVNMLDVEIEPGVTGEDLQKIYEKAYENLFKNNYEKLMERLGLTDTIVTENVEQVYEVQEENTIFDKLKERDSKLEETEDNITKDEIKKEYLMELGKKEIERVDFINENFDKIVAEFATAKVNIFFEEGKPEFDKNCK